MSNTNNPINPNQMVTVTQEQLNAIIAENVAKTIAAIQAQQVQAQQVQKKELELENSTMDEVIAVAKEKAEILTNATADGIEWTGEKAKDIVEGAATIIEDVATGISGLLRNLFK